MSNHKTLPWAQANNFALPADPSQPFFADLETAGEAYLDRFADFHPDPVILTALTTKALQPSGLLGFVQGVGPGPPAASRSSRPTPPRTVSARY